MDYLVPVLAGVPTDRLYPCGVPKEAMGEKVPYRRMVPTIS